MVGGGACHFTIEIARIDNDRGIFYIRYKNSLTHLYTV
jgi:hypothetical protein